MSDFIYPCLSFLGSFGPLFSASVWLHAQPLLIGAILAPGRRTVCSVLRLMGLGKQPHFQNFHRVLNRAQWSPLAAAQLLLRILVKTFCPTGKLIFVIDETIERRWGKRIEQRGIYRDAARSSKSVTNQASGLRWLSVQLIVWIPWAKKRWALPFLTVLAPSERYYQKRHLRHKKLTHVARQAILQVRKWLPGRELVFVADSSYSVVELLLFCEKLNVIMIVPLRLDAVLHKPAPPRAKGRLGRPRKKGAPLPKLKQVLEEPKTRWLRSLVQWYGQGKRTVELSSGTAVWNRSGLPVLPIRWILVRDPRGQFESRAFLSTLPSQEAKEILETFTCRWQVEVTFEETRAHLGLETQRQWNSKAIARTTPILLGLFSVVTLLAHQLRKQKIQPLGIRRAAWYRKPAATFSDALALVRRQLWEESFCKSTTAPDVQKSSYEVINHFADLLCYSW
jgi:hypothetical protein